MDLQQASGTGAGSGPTLRIGPALDATGVEYTGLVIADITLTKNGVSAVMAANATLTHVDNGFYDLVMIGNNVDTLGRLQVSCNKDTYQFPPETFMVLPATVFNALYVNAAGEANGLPLSKANNIVDSNLISVGPTGANTAQTAADVGAQVTAAASSAATAATQSTTAAAQSTVAATQSTNAAASAASGLTATNAVGVIVTAIQTILTGITSLAAWLRWMTRSDAGTGATATALTLAGTEINVDGGSALKATDNLQANYDKAVTVDEDAIADAVVEAIQDIPGFAVEVTSPTDSSGEIEVRQGDAYLAANSRNISIGLTGSLPSLETACTLRVFFGGTKTDYTGAITVNSATDYTLKFDLTGAQTAAMPAGVFSYEVEVTFTGTSNKWTPSTGQFTVLSQIG